MNDENTFQGVLIELSRNIKSKNIASSQLNAIVENGLKLAQEVDLNYQKQRVFSKVSQSLLYKVAFELFSYQHQSLLDNLKHQDVGDYSQILEHGEVFVRLFYDFRFKTSDNLRDRYLTAWQQTIFVVTDFLDIIPSKKTKQSLLFSEMSANTRYAIISSCIFVLGIFIATLLIIQW